MRSHAAWALGRFGGAGARARTRTRAKRETDSEVGAEIEVALAALARLGSTSRRPGRIGKIDGEAARRTG